MDGPVLVPCEKLDPIPDLGGGPLPRFCVHFAMIYHILLIFGSCIIVVLFPKFFPAYMDSAVWTETVFFAVFWSVLVVEILVVGFCTIFDTAKNLNRNAGTPETLQELFPIVDAATVDDFVYKSEAGRILRKTVENKYKLGKT